MKKYSLFLIVIFLIISRFFLSAGNCPGEDKRQSRKKKQRFKQQLTSRKKLWPNRRKLRQRHGTKHEEEQMEIEYSGYESELIDKAMKSKDHDDMPRGNRSFNFDEPFEFSGPDMQGFYGHSMG